jgi:large subunit ribosomal protein L4
MSKTQTKNEATLKGVVSPKSLGIEIPTSKASSQEFAVWVRALLQNWRQGTVGCKDRSDVARTGKKPFKQKGTGRARAGTAGSPVWRGGGVSFGPQPRTKTLRIAQQQKTRVLMSIASQYLQNDRVLSADWTAPEDRPKTSVAFALLKTMGIQDKKITLLIPTYDVVSYASFANIPNVRLMYFDQPNAFDLVTSDYWVVFNKDLDSLKTMVEKWS